MTEDRFGPTRRGGPLFRWLGEPLAIDLANTVMVVREGQEVDLLASPGHLQRWLDAERPRLGRHAVGDRLADALLELRDATRMLLRAAATGDEPPRWAMKVVNQASAASPIAPQLTAGSRGELSAAELSSDEGTPASLLGQIARSAIELLSTPRRSELNICHAPSCGMLFLGGRRWCCSACGNRARAARHYERARRAGRASQS